MVQKEDSKIWQPAIYARLSDEDRNSKINGVSMSIDHQVDLLKAFVKQKGWQEPKVFYDDNISGTSFDREGWQALYAEAQEGRINLILVKDTSRFGRNWVLSGDYFTKIEAMGVRFISLQEGIDTIDPQCPALRMLPFYFIFNEWHSQTTSEKIRAIFARQAELGKFWATFAPYGYEKDPDDRHRLIVDPVAGDIVRRIFALRLQKLSYGAIVRTLNDEGVLAPNAYSAEKQDLKKKLSQAGGKWSVSSLINILSNPVYCGDIVHGRFGYVSYKNRRRIQYPEEHWTIVTDMHEPLVSREDWQKCDDMRSDLRVRSTAKNGVPLFSGLLKCADCGYKMRRQGYHYFAKKTSEKKSLYTYICGAFVSKGKTACSSHYILERDLCECVLADIRKKASEVLHDEDSAREMFYSIKTKTSGMRVQSEKSKLKKVNKRLGELNALLQAAFERSVLSGESTDVFSGFAKKFETEKTELTKQALELSALIESHSQIERDVETFIALLKKHADITELDRATVVALIDQIEISANTVKPREIVIHYNFMGSM